MPRAAPVLNLHAIRVAIEYVAAVMPTFVAMKKFDVFNSLLTQAK